MADPIQLTPEQVQEYEAKAGPQPVNPLKDFDAATVADLSAKDPSFDIVSEFRRNADLHGDPTFVQKTADALDLVEKRGFKLADLPSPKQAGGAVLESVKGFGKQLWNYASAANNVLSAAATAPFSTNLSEGYAEQATKNLGANVAGTEEAVSGLSELAQSAAHKARRIAGPEFTPEQKVAHLWDKVGKGEVAQQRLEGQGPVSQFLNKGEAPKQKPEEVSELSAGDPFSFYTFGKAMSAAGGLVGKAIPAAAKGAVGAAVSNASEKAAEVGGGAIKAGAKALEVSGKIAQPIGKAASVLGPIAGAVGLVAGVEPLTAVGKGLIGGTAGVALRRAGEVAVEMSPKISAFGAEVAGSAPAKSAYALAGKDFLQALPGAAGQVAHGAAVDLGLAAVTSETPQQTQGAASFGTVLGAVHGAGRVAGRMISGQIIAPREYGIKTPVSSSGQFKSLDAMHNAAFREATPGVKARLNAVREFVSGTGAKADVFLAKDSAAAERALVDSGVDAETAKQWAAQSGFFTTGLVGKDGQPRRVVVMRDVEAAPHESFHVLQDVLGESANREIDKVVRDAYADRWDTEGENYARRLVGDLGGKTWQETVLDASGWGLDEAKEKIYRDIYNRIRGETGAEPAPGLVEEQAKAALGRVLDNAVQGNQHMQPNEVQRHAWRDVLSPDEAQSVADRYIARELAAENFDAVFKAGALKEPTTLPGKLARMAGKLVSVLGGEPLEGRNAAFSKAPLRTPVVEAVKKTAKAALPETKPTVELKAPPPAPKGKAPASPEDEKQSAGEEAQKIADEAPTAPQAGGTRSPKELLGEIAQSIARGEGVKLNYLSAPDEPAAATTSNRETRRAIIETFRTMPQEARALWEKTFFPDRVIKTKTGYQVLGWAPEVFAANAHKMATFLSEHAGLSPYEIDTATKTFTPDAWQALYNDVQTFVKNQKAGATGAGESLVVPRDVISRGFTSPATKETAGQLDQTKADFINLLFNFKLPETPRILKGKLPLNIAGQDISAATKPGRVEVPVRPRGEFTGDEARAQGIEGRLIAEVNPLRNQIEAAAKASGAKLPSLIEAVQRLNLENIKEVEGAPEAPEFRGNTLTLTAGFQPRTESGKKLVEEGYKFERQGYRGTRQIFIMDGMKKIGEISSSQIEDTSSVGDVYVDKSARNKGIGEALYRELLADLQADGATSVAGVAISKGPLRIREKIFGGYETETDIEHRDGSFAKFVTNKISPTAQFNPVELASKIEKFTPEEFRKWTEELKTSGGFTKAAHDLGIEAPSREFAEQLKKTYADFQTRFKDTLKAGDFDSAGVVAAQGQFFREAYEAATGTGSAGEHLRKLDANYKPSFPPEDASSAQAQPVGLDEVKEVAEEYARSAGRDYVAGERPYANLNADLMTRLSDFYAEAQHEPENAEVVRSYEALADETVAQWNAIKAAGYDLEPWEDKGEPYKSSAEMVADVRDNKHLFYLPSEGTFKGAEGNHLMLVDSGIGGRPVNDIFRAVHDFFGHAKEGYQFGPRGEFNAWQTHSEMYSDAAQGALAAETLAQNAWVNFGPHMRGESKPGPKERPFAEQKNTTIAPELIDEARGLVAQFTPKKAKDDLKLLRTQVGYSNAWVLPDGTPVQLGAMWHHQWLAEDEVGKAIAKRYGLKVPEFEGVDDAETRQAALKKGFVRIKYNAANGKLTVEALASKWPKLKATVQDLAEKNIDNIDSMTVNLLDKDVSGIVNSGSRQLFSYGSNKEKMENLPLMDETQTATIARTEEPSFRAPDAPEERIPYAYMGEPEFQVFDKTGKFVGKRATYDAAKTEAENIGGHVKIARTTRWQAQPDAQVEEQETFAGMNAGREYVGNAAVANMTREELAHHFPEAVLPTPRDAEIHSDIVKAPLYKQAGSEEKATEAFAEKLVEFANEYKEDPAYKAGSEWYSKFAPMLKKAFGKDAQIFAELLAATSPQTAAGVNFGYAFDALKSLRDGRFDKIIPKFEQGLEMISEDKWVPWYNKELKAGNIPKPPAQPTPAAFLEAWIHKHDLKPKQSNGSLYGTHSIPVLQVFARKWLTESRGPKTLNFVKNLVGDGHEATIDLWADRTMRRVGYSGFKDHWRILPGNGTGVSAEDFAFGQKAFRAAAKKLGMKPDALQGALWFAEKKLWSDKGWGRLDLGDFSTEMMKIPMLTSGYNQRTSEKKAPKAEPLDLFVEPRNLKR